MVNKLVVRPIFSTTSLSIFPCNLELRNVFYNNLLFLILFKKKKQEITETATKYLEVMLIETVRAGTKYLDPSI